MRALGLAFTGSQVNEVVAMKANVAAAFAGLALGLGACVAAPPPPQAIVQNCQQFTQDITVAGKSVPGYGVQCQQPDGTWTVTVPPQATPPQAAAAAPAYPYPWQVPDYAYPYVYPYGGAYSVYPWYYGPDVYVGLGGGAGWYGHGGGWYGGHWSGGGWHAGGWTGHGEGGGHR
jgi:hypothetical protein